MLKASNMDLGSGAAMQAERGGGGSNLQVAPDFGGRELGQALHGGPHRQGAQQGVHDAVDVVQREAVQDAVPLLPLPGRAQPCHLGVQAAMCVQGTCMGTVDQMLSPFSVSYSRWTGVRLELAAIGILNKVNLLGRVKW